MNLNMPAAGPAGISLEGQGFEAVAQPSQYEMYQVHLSCAGAQAMGCDMVVAAAVCALHVFRGRLLLYVFVVINVWLSRVPHYKGTNGTVWRTPTPPSAPLAPPLCIAITIGYRSNPAI